MIKYYTPSTPDYIVVFKYTSLADTFWVSGKFGTSRAVQEHRQTHTDTDKRTHPKVDTRVNPVCKYVKKKRRLPHEHLFWPTLSLQWRSHRFLPRAKDPQPGNNDTEWSKAKINLRFWLIVLHLLLWLPVSLSKALPAAGSQGASPWWGWRRLVLDSDQSGPHCGTAMSRA